MGRQLFESGNKKGDLVHDAYVCEKRKCIKKRNLCLLHIS